MKTTIAGKTRLLTRSVVPTFLLLFALPTLASDVVGKLQFVAGEVKAIAADGSTRLLKKGDRIYTGETIKSGDGGTAQVIMQDQNRLVVRTGTELKVKEFKFDEKNPQDAKSVILLQQGAIRSFSGPGDKGEGQHVIETPLATVGVAKGDREIIHIKQEATASSPAKGLPAGTFSKVYAGQAVVESPQGKLLIGKHQIGRVTGAPGKVEKPETIAELPTQVEKRIGSGLVGMIKPVATKDSGGKMAIGPVDVAKTPPLNPATPPGVPVPYPNAGMGTDLSKGTAKVKMMPNEVVLKNSSFKQSIGNEAGPQKGLVTSINTGKTMPKTFSMDVKVESNNVVRSLDMTTKNHQSAAPAGTKIVPSQMTVIVK